MSGMTKKGLHAPSSFSLTTRSYELSSELWIKRILLCEFAERDLLPTMQSHAGTRDLRDFSMWGLYAPNLDKEIGDRILYLMYK